MLFHEVYGSYYNVVAQILSEAVRGELTNTGIMEIIREKAFGESVLTIPANLINGDWPLLRANLTTPIRHSPTMPLTTLQKSWMKALLLDRRIALFDLAEDGLKDVEPLFLPETFVYYDRSTNGDDYSSQEYIRNFRTVLSSLREKRKLRVRFVGQNGRGESCICIPRKLEYSAKDDKFRLQADVRHGILTVNLGRMISCDLREPYSPEELRRTRDRTRSLVFELTDERNALERVMLHFSHFERETEKLDETHYRVTLKYDRYDETELVIRLLSFGPVIKVLSPESIIENIRDRVNKQVQLRA